MINLKKPFQWDEINDAVRAQLQTSALVRSYQSLSQAILETTISFQNLYSHKRQFSYSIGLGTHVEEAMIYLSRQGIKGLELKKEETIDDKKNLFFLMDVDDAITAELYPQQISADDKNFKISISHHSHRFSEKLPSVSETEVMILSIEGWGALAVHGKRCASLPSFLSSTLPWSSYAAFPSFKLKKQNPIWVQNLESKSIAGSHPLEGLTKNRIFDRALLAWTDLEGEALRQTLINEQGLPAEQMEALSLSRWNELRLISQFQKRGWGPEIFRGLLLISVELANDPGLNRKIEEAVQSLRTKSTLVH